MFAYKGLNCVFQSYKQGLLFYKNYLKLNDGGSKEVGVAQQGHQYTRMTGEANMAQGHTVDPISEQEGKRGITAALATGTIYGMAQTVVDAGRQQSFFGLNRECVNRDGFPNSTLVAKYLRETAPSVDIKEQRINLFQDVMLAGDFYDNATSLIAVILIKIHRARMSKRLATFNHTLRFRLADVIAWARIPDARQQWDTLKTMVRSGPTACGVADSDSNLSSIKRALLDRVDGVEPNVDLNTSITYNVKVWKMYEYNDGHSRSGDHFGDHFDFINGRYIVPQNINHAPETNDMNVTFMPSEVPRDDNAIKHLKQFKYWVNTSNLTEKECTVLLYCLKGNVRMSPLLIDQNIDFGLTPNSVVFVGPEVNVLNSTTYDDNDLLVLLHKLCTTHRWHEDALNAAKLLRPWYCQPSTETVEAHWWTHIHRVCRLPSLGLKRASIPCLLLGDAVCTSVEAIREYDGIVNSNDGCVVDSLLYNTAWYWGEYMMIMNAKNVRELLKNMRLNIRDELDVATRANILVSAILGQEVPLCSYQHCYTFIKGGIDGHKTKHVPIGHVQIDHLEEYGYAERGEDVLFNSMVAPGCVAMLCGRAGSLLDGTPYHATFKINPMINEFDDGHTYRTMNYGDLWAYGVVARWQGHNVRYKHPLNLGSHRIYAANNVSVAMPPTTPCKLRRPENYRFVGVERRDKCWGSDFSHRLYQEQVFTWSVIRFEVLSEPEWLAEVVVREDLMPNLPKYYTTAADIVANTLARLTARYDLALAGFHVDTMIVGMPLRNDTPAAPFQNGVDQMEQPNDELPPQADGD